MPFDGLVPDHLSPGGAAALAARIMEYWAARGVAVAPQLVPVVDGREPHVALRMPCPVPPARRSQKPGRTVIVNRFHPPGSNARLLAAQTRGEFGFTHARATVDGPKLLQAPLVARPLVSSVAEPVPIVAAQPRPAAWPGFPLIEADRRLMHLLARLATERAVLPGPTQLVDLLGLRWQSRLEFCFGHLEKAGAIRQWRGRVHPQRGQRVVVIVETGQVLRTAGAPQEVRP